MRTIAGQFILALALFAAGIACWMEARLARRLAEAHERLATVHYDSEDGIDETMTVVNRLPWPGGSLGADIERHRATVSYWRAQYRELMASLPSMGGNASAVTNDPQIMLVAANAAFRASLANTSDRPATIERLDGVIQAYADALRRAPDNADASYNYEYVTRFRDTFAKSRAPARGAVAGKAATADTRRLDRSPGRADNPWRPGRPAARDVDGEVQDHHAAAVRRTRAGRSRPRGAGAPQGVVRTVLPRIEFDQIVFAQPDYLWLLVCPVVLIGLWIRRFTRRRGDARRLASRRMIPVRERFGRAGDLPFWLLLIGAASCLIVAAARPYGPASTVRLGGVDLVILQDASASMRVKDMQGDRWQRSMKFLRLLGDSLSWKSDRIALAVFAHIAAPQIRLTTDPNTFFFFLDHLDKEPPFRIEEDTTWDTNLELGIHWGLRMMERDEECTADPRMRRCSWCCPTASSGAARSSRRCGKPWRAIFRCSSWASARSQEGGCRPSSGPTARRSATRRPQRLPGSIAPRCRNLPRRPAVSISSSSATVIGESPTPLIDTGKRIAPSIGLRQDAEELYWYFLLMAAALLLLGILFVRDRPELWLQLAGGGLVLIWASSVFNG